MTISSAFRKLAVFCIVSILIWSLSFQAAFAALELNPVPTTVPTGSTEWDWVTKERVAKVALKFAGLPMTNARAKSMAEAAGFNYIGWQTCAGRQECLVLHVQGKGLEAPIFQYVVLSERCRVLTPNTTDSIILPTDIQRPGQAARARTLVPASGSPSTHSPASSTANPVAAEKPGKTVTSCFAGYTSKVRSREHNSFSIDRYTYFFKFEENWQTIVQGKWTDQLKQTFIKWLTPLPNSGASEVGTAYDWLDATGKVLATDRSVIEAIASSGTTNWTKDEMCKATQDRNRARAAAVSAMNDAVCVGLPIPDQITVGISAVGVVQATKHYDYCAVARNIGDAVADNVASFTYDDCMKNPGRYDSQFLPEPGPVSIEGVLGFEPLAPNSLNLPGGSCPSTLTKKSSPITVSGETCTTETRYDCGIGDVSGLCVCNKKSEARVCTG